MNMRITALILLFTLLLIGSAAARADADITFSASGAASSAAGPDVSGSIVTLTEAGVYRLSGECADGQVIVDAGKEDTVVLELSGLSLTCASGPAIWVKNADLTLVRLIEGTENRLQSGAVCALDDSLADEDATGGALYAKDDLTVEGDGALFVGGYLYNGIHCTNDLILSGGEITVEAIHNGIRGKDSVVLSGGTITVSAGNKGVCSDLSLTVSGGDIRILQSDEGLEANQVLLSGGSVDIVSSDDGVNANGGTESAFGRSGSGGKNSRGGFFGGAAQEAEEEVISDTPNLIITGGTLRVNAEGDGLDSNGNLLLSGGEIVIDGPSRSGNGVLDAGTESGGGCSITGGTVLAIGASGMSSSFDSSSTQPAVSCSFSGSLPAGTEITITAADGTLLFSHTSAKSFSMLVFSSPELVSGENVTVRVGTQSVQLTAGASSSLMNGRGRKGF